MLPPDYPGLVNGQNPAELATAMLHVLAVKSGERVRRHFQGRFTLEHHLADLAAALRSVENDQPPRHQEHQDKTANPSPKQCDLIVFSMLCFLALVALVPWWFNFLVSEIDFFR
jgi:type VI protein secretion system component VasF